MVPRNLEYLHTILNNIHDLVIVIVVGPEESYKVAYLNKAFSDFVGYTDIVGKQVSEVVEPETYASLRAHYRQAKSTKKEVTFLLPGTSTPNGVLSFEVKLIPILNTLGECVQIIAISREMPAASAQLAV